MTLNAFAVLQFLGTGIEGFVENKYTISILTLVIFFIATKLLAFIIEKIILKATSKTKTELDDLLVKRSHGPISVLLFLIGAKLAVVPLRLEENINTIVQRSITSLIILVLAWVIIRITDILFNALLHRHATRRQREVDETIRKIGTRASTIILLMFALIFIFHTWSIEIGPLLASLGIIGVAVAFGLQSTVGNIFGGISLLLDRSVKVGDVIKISEEANGTVIDVGLRATKIRTWNNEVVIVPNGKLAGENIKNYVLPNYLARIEVPFSVAYGSGVDQVKKIVMNEIKKLDNLESSNEPSVMFIEMSSSSLNFKAFVWIKSYKERFGTKEKLNCMIYNALNKSKITIPFPQMDVHLDMMQNKSRKPRIVDSNKLAKRKVKRTGEQ